MTEAQQEEMLIRILQATQKGNGKSNHAIVAAVLVAIAPMLASIAVWFKAHSTHQLVNSRMTELLMLTKEAATLAGKNEQARSTSSQPVGRDQNTELLNKIEALLKSYQKQN